MILTSECTISQMMSWQTNFFTLFYEQVVANEVSHVLDSESIEAHGNVSAGQNGENLFSCSGS